MRGKIDFKGTKDGIVLHIKGDLNFDWIQMLVQKKLKLARHFFEGAHIIGSTGYTFTEEEEFILSRLIEAQSGMKVLTLEPFDFSSQSIVYIPPAPSAESSQRSDSFDARDPGDADVEVETTEDTVVANETVVVTNADTDVNTDTDTDADIEAFTHQRDGVIEERDMRTSDTIFHKGTLRSGRRIDSTGNIIILGDVNPGAELKARGNIVVMGALRGLAHAGSDGDEEAFVAAIKLMPTQLRIHKNISRPPDGGQDEAHYPEIAYIKDGHIIIEPYL